MTLMSVNNPNEQGKDSGSRPRWSAGKKTDAVLRLLRGEPLEELSRELKVEAHRLAAWRDDFLAAGKHGLKGQRVVQSPDDRALKQAERKLGQLTRLSRSPWNFGGGPMLDQAASSLVGVTAVAMVWSRATRSAGRCR